MDLGQLAADIVARNKAAREKSTDIAGRMAKALSDERWKYFNDILDDTDGPDGVTEGDATQAPGSSRETGAMDIAGGI